MLDEENKYFQQAKQATLAEIGLNQQAMLESAMTPPEPEPETLNRAQITVDSNARPVYGKAVSEVPDEGIDVTRSVPTGPVIADGEHEPSHPDAEPKGAEGAVSAVQAASQSRTPFYDVVDESYAIQQSKKNEAAKQLEMDPRALRAENSRKWVAGIGDALASIANLIGTANDASHQKQVYSLPGVNAAIEQDRQRRNAQYQKQLDRINAMELQKAKAEADAAKQAAQIASQEKRAANQLAYTKEKDEADRALKKYQWETETEFKKRQQDHREAQDAINNGLGRARLAETIRHNKANESEAIKKREQSMKGTGMSRAVADYNAMKNEIARNLDYPDWKSLYAAFKNMRYSDEKYKDLNEIVSKFEIGRDGQVNESKIRGVISEFAQDWAPEFHKKYFGYDDGAIDFSGFGGGTLKGME